MFKGTARVLRSARRWWHATINFFFNEEEGFV